MIILQEAINTFSFSPHIDKESPADKPVTCLRDFFRQNRTRAASRLKPRGFCLSTWMNPADTSELMWWEIVAGDRPMPLKKSGAGADDHLVERKMLHPELLHEVCGFPGQRRPRLRSGSVEFGLKRRLVGLNDGGAEGKQLLVSLEIDLRLPPELGAEPLRLLAARIDREELQQVLKILHLRRKLRAAVERERDQMPQRLRLGKHLGLLLGDQRKTLPCPAPTAPARSSLRANRTLAL